MVEKKTLLLIAAFIWIVAGFNILRLGVISYEGYVNLLHLSLSLLIFLMFWYMVFKKLVMKHTLRIRTYKETKRYFWNFFDIPSFIIMSFMMSVGILIRTFQLLPDVFIAVFYSGLGTALLLAGIKFFINYTVKVE